MTTITTIFLITIVTIIVVLIGWSVYVARKTKIEGYPEAVEKVTLEQPSKVVLEEKLWARPQPADVQETEETVSVVKPIYEQPTRSPVVDVYTAPAPVEAQVEAPVEAPKKVRKPRVKKPVETTTTTTTAPAKKTRRKVQ
jgi:hypothetical protein